VLVAKIILLAIVSLLWQAGGREPRTGSYNILVDKKPAGVERFEQTISEQNLVVRSSTEITSGGAPQKITAMTEMSGGRLVRYEMETGAGERLQKYSLQFESGIARVVIEAYGRRSERAVPVSEEVMLLDKNVWHHYGLLINKFDMKKRGPQRFSVLTPQAGLRQYIAEVELKEKTIYNAQGTKIGANLFIVTLGEGYEVIVIADESNRVLSIEVPALDTKAVLQL
jgi:hypothetical protein